MMGAAHAGPETVTVTGPAATPLRGLFPNEGDAVVGEYRMADGRVMVLRQRGRVILANLDGVPTTRLLAGESGILQAADDSMRLRFDNDAKNDSTAVTVSLRSDGGNAITLASIKATGR
jgi:hypothetical protein